MHTRRSQHNGFAVAAVELAQAGVEVSAHGNDFQIAPEETQLRLATQAAGSDPRATGKFAQPFSRRRDQYVACIFALGDSGDDEAGGRLRGNG